MHDAGGCELAGQSPGVRPERACDSPARCPAPWGPWGLGCCCAARHQLGVLPEKAASGTRGGDQGRAGNAGVSEATGAQQDPVGAVRPQGRPCGVGTGCASTSGWSGSWCRLGEGPGWMPGPWRPPRAVNSHLLAAQAPPHRDVAPPVKQVNDLCLGVCVRNGEAAGNRASRTRGTAAATLPGLRSGSSSGREAGARPGGWAFWAGGRLGRVSPGLSRVPGTEGLRCLPAEGGRIRG